MDSGFFFFLTVSKVKQGVNEAMRFWMELWMEEGNLHSLGGSRGPNTTAGEKRKMIFSFFFLKSMLHSAS